MSFNIKVTPENNPTRIEGYCDIPGWRNKQSVITFSTINGKWHTASSMCLPSDIEAAKIVQECVAAAFAKLSEYDDLYTE